MRLLQQIDSPADLRRLRPEQLQPAADEVRQYILETMSRVGGHTGAETWPGSISSLKRDGRLVTCGATSGFDARTDLRQVFYRHLNLLGSFMGSKAELLDAMKFVERGAIRAVVDRALPLGEARRAHELMQDRAQFGKLVLVP